MRMKTFLIVLMLSGIAALPLASQDWPMWGGTVQRNMTSAMKNLPESWDVENGKNLKWKAEIGTDSYGNPRRPRHFRKANAMLQKRATCIRSLVKRHA